MANFKYVTTDRDRICKICGDKMTRNTWGIVLKNCHISPKKIDIHFHEGCFFRSLDNAKKERNNDKYLLVPLSPIIKMPKYA